MALTDQAPYAINPVFSSPETNKYTPVLYSKKVMMLFVEQTILGEITNGDYEGDIKGKGDQVEVRVAPPTLSVQDYIAGADIDFTTAGYAARTLNIDQAKVVAFEFDEIEKVQSDLNLFNIYADRAALSLDIYVSRDVLGKMGAGAYNDSGDIWGAHTSGNQGATAGKVTGGYDLGVYTGTQATNDANSIDATNALDFIVDLSTVLDEADVPMEGRFVVLPAWYCNLLQKTDLKAADVTGDSTGVIRTGLIGEISNFKVYKSNLLYSSLADVVDGGAAVDTVAFHVVAGLTDATTFASQVTKTEISKVENGFGEKWKTLQVYGRKVIQPEALAMLYCTKG
jgi:hypothetical protein